MKPQEASWNLHKGFVKPHLCMEPLENPHKILGDWQHLHMVLAKPPLYVQSPWGFMKPPVYRGFVKNCPYP